MKALTATEMREVDRLTTERYGIPSLQLMESAGQKVADAVWRVVAARENVRVCVLCGMGNNGGDGFVAARRLKDAGLTIRVFLFGKAEDARGDAATNLSRWRDAGNKIESIVSEPDWERVLSEVSSAIVLVDALLGTGLRGPATGLFARVITDINRLSRNATLPRPALILAVDTPSGLPADGDALSGPVLFAHCTVTFTAPKVGQLISRNAEACGALEVVSIGSPSELIEATGKSSLRCAGPDEFASLPLVRAATSHKGTFGHVLLVAGSLGKSGAAVLAGHASLRGGAGLTTIASPDVVQATIASAHPEYMVEALASTETGTMHSANLSSGRFARILEGKSVLGIGPGLGTHPETQRAIQQVVRESFLPVILDADGLNAFVGKADLLKERKSPFLAITPHPGEMARLLGVTNIEVQSDRLRAASEAARRWTAHVVLKGYHSIVASPDGQVFVNTTGNAGLGKGGTGDVLTGILSALIAQFGTGDGARVLSLGVYLHGLAAELASTGTDLSGLLASEVADAVPDARWKLLEELRKLV